MSVSFDSGGGRKRKGSGFSAAIGLCLAAVCLVAAATAINSRTDKGKDDNYISNYVSNEGDSVWLGVEEDGSGEIFIETDSEQDTAVDAMTGGIIDTQTEPTGSEQPDTEQEAEAVFAELTESGSLTAEDMVLTEEESVPAATSVRFRMPLDGTITKEYSGNDLVYCSTMGDWRVHNGVDISGTLDCEVYAAADGIVVDFTEDMLYGYTAIIRHSDDSMLYYCGLSSVPKVSAGLEVHAGDVIGYLGVVPGESADEPHLHLAMMKDGEFVDPIKTMGL